MLLALIIFPASVLLAVGTGFFCLIRCGRASIEFWACLLTLVYLLFNYAAGFVAINFHPYWIDNEVEVFIPFSERWSWALLNASVFEVLLWPLPLLGYSILRARYHRDSQPSRPSNGGKIA